MSLYNIAKVAIDFTLAIDKAADEDGIVNIKEVEECEVIFENSVEDGLTEARNRAEGMI